MKTTPAPLPDSALTHAGIKPVLHPRLDRLINGQTAVRYLRFTRPARLERLELAPAVYGRWVPAVPTHPAHLLISILDTRTGRWQLVREVDLPPDPRIAGAELSQQLSEAAMNERLAKVLRKKPHVIDLGGLRTDHLRVECDREHRVWPSHGECNGGEYNVPFGILNKLAAYGKPVGRPGPQPAYLPVLKVGRVHPRAPRGMTVRQTPLLWLFESRHFSVGFSLRRPMLLHLGWDALGRGGAGRNRLVNSLGGDPTLAAPSLSGPVLQTLSQDCLAYHWTGHVSLAGNQVRYRDLRCAVSGVTLDATFEVEPDRLRVTLTQHADRALPVLEAEAWRLAWDNAAAMTGAMALPTLRPGRNGEVQLPMLWAGDGVGCLSCRCLAGDPEQARLQVESYRPRRSVVGGFVLGPRPAPDACAVVPAGTRQATFEWAVTNLAPQRKPRAPRPSTGLTANWAAIYSCFRPEYGGFSNNAISVNCHVNQGGPAEIVAHTRPPAHGPHPLALQRFTIERALLDGGGYGYWRNLYLDSDPVLLSAAGRIHQAQPDPGWLERIAPGLRESARRIRSQIGAEDLVICRALSGNSGSFRWSSNAMDVIGFGHLDAYVNAWTYRALRNATALLTDLGDHAEAQRCRAAAVKLRRAFAKYLLNPQTGWVAGWRSRDGQLHDSAFLFVNGPACAFGLLDPPVARRALHRLEALRQKVGAGPAVTGLPCSLLPIDRADHMLPQLRAAQTYPTFESYTDGSMMTCFATYYLRALACHGLRAPARRLARELDQGYAAGLWVGGAGSGVEFRDWDGVPSGYEGTFVLNYGALYALAIDQGLITPSNPEWWPANG